MFNPAFENDGLYELSSKKDMEFAPPTKPYDPYDYCKNENGTSFWGIVGHLILISLGPVLLTIPQTFVQVGYVLGVAGTIITVCLYAYCIRMLINIEYELCKRVKKPSLSYVETVKEAFEAGPDSTRFIAPYAQVLIYFVFLCVWLGGNSINFLLAADNIKNSLDFFYGTAVRIEVLHLYLILPLVLLCWIPNLKLLVPLSTFTNIVNAVCVCIMLYETLIDPLPFDQRLAFGSFGGISKLVGVQLFCITATCFVLPMKNELSEPQKFGSRFGVINTSYFPVLLVYSIFGLLCYIKYGDQSESNIIQNLPPTTFYKFMIGLYGIGNCFFYPLVAFASYDIIRNNALKNFFDNINGQRNLIAHEYVCRTICGLLPIVFAYGLPNLNLFLSLTGTVGTSIDSLIMPALLQLLISYRRSINYLNCAKSILILVFGVFLMTVGTYDCVGAFLKNET